VKWWEAAPLAPQQGEDDSWWRNAPLATPAGQIPGAAPGDVAPESRQTQRTLPQELARQVGLTARAGVQGVGGVVGLLVDPLTAILNLGLPEDKKGATVYNAAKDLADALGLPKPETAGERVVGMAAEGVAGAGGMVGAARQASAALTGRGQVAAQMMAAQPGQQLAGGAGAGAALQGVVEGGGETGSQVVAALAGGLAGAKGARMAARRAAPAAQVAQDAQLVQDAQRAGVRLATSDVAPPGTFVGRTAQTTGERIPFAGTGSMREQQQVQRQTAVRELVKDFGADVTTKNDERVAAELLRKRGDDLTKYTSLKSQAMNEAATLAPGPVNVSRAVAQIDAEILALQRMTLPEADRLIPVLQGYRQGILNKDVATLDQVRKTLGDAITDPQLASARTIGEKIPSRVYAALRQDFDAHMGQAGRRTHTKWRVAMGRLSEMAGEANNNRLRTALNTGRDVPETVTALLFSSKPSDVRRLYRNLTPQGREAARAAILSKAWEDATTAGAQNVSPQVFANSVRKLGSQVGVFFKPDDVQRIEGLARVINATRRAGDFAANPPTGTQLALPVGAAVLADIGGGAGAGLAVGASIGGLARVYESAAVRNALLQVRRTRPGSPEEAAAIKRATAAWQAEQRKVEPQSEDEE
jgi:hypothetical protein